MIIPNQAQKDEIDEFNVTGELAKVLERSAIISYMFEDDEIRTAYFLLAMIKELSPTLFEPISETGLFFDANGCINNLLSNKDAFEIVFGKKAAEEFFDRDEEDDDEESEENEKSEESLNLTEEELDKMIHEKAALKIDEILGSMVTTTYIDEEVADIMYSNKFYDAYKNAINRVKTAKKNILDVPNLFVSIMENKETSAYKLLSSMLAPFQITIDDIISAIKSTFVIYECKKEETFALPSNISTFCAVLNTKYKKGEKSDILNREREIFKLFSIFSKRSKSNALIIGEAGVGKTAIMEALTQRIVNGECPEEFKNHTVIELNISSMVSGTKYRGEFEAKVTALEQYLKDYDNLILFVDEAHHMVGAGGSSDQVIDLSGALKPLLARNDIIFVGSTTKNEYERFIKRDSAFERRFEIVEIDEPKIEELYDMISLRIKNLEEYHKVTISRKILDYCILMAYCLKNDRNNPDKTLDVCDGAMAIAKMRNSKVVEKEDINNFFYENFKKYAAASREEKLKVAYHEAGHFLVNYLTGLEKINKTLVVSIIPGFDFLGVNITEKVREYAASDVSWLEKTVQMCLAGKYAQKYVTNDDFGASEDIKEATRLVYYSQTNGCLNGCTFYNDLDLSEIKECYSDNKKEELINNLNEFMESERAKVINLLSVNQKKLVKIVEYLLKHEIVSGQELIKIIS